MPDGLRAARPARVEIFGFDAAEASQIRRIRLIAALGHEVHSFTMRRGNMNAGFAPDWPNTHLFHTANERLGRRAAIVAASILRMAGHRRRIRAADVILARNLDMLAIAAAARAMAGARHVPLVYECLDIHGALTAPGARGRAMRAAERRLLRGVQMLAVSSPAFVERYFNPVQGWDGPVALWENRIAAGTALPPRPRTRPAPARPLRLGWVGTIRCAPTLALLAALADRMGERLAVEIHGVVHRHVLPDFDAVLAARPNMRHHGPYRYPDDLARTYAGCDLVWAQDLWQRGANSDWLLPNRIYEAGWAGCPSLAVAGTETGRRVEADALGWTVTEPTAEAVAALLDRLSPEAIAGRGAALLARSEADFVQDPAEIAEALDRARGLAA